MAIKRLGAQRFSGLDADVASLPIDADLIGAIFSSTDTLKFWIFNGTTWNESAGGGGGITGLNPNSTILDHSTTLADYTSPSTASATSEDGANVAANAVDGSTTTFWQSNAGINESITIDMGSVLNDFALAFYIDKTQTGITETQFQIQSLAIPGFDVTDLKAYWKFDELSGSIINVSTAGVSLGSNADLTVAGSPTYNQSGSPTELGNSVLWGATGAGGTAGSSLSQFNFMHNTTGLFTLCVWLKFPSAVATNNVLINDNNFSDDPIGLNIRTQANSNFRLLMGSGSVVIDVSMSTNSIPTDNAFHFYVFRWDVTLGSNNLSFRRDDGNEELFTKTGSATNSNAFQAMQVADNSSGVELAANMLEMSIWNRILTAGEETTLYNNGDGLSISGIAETAKILRTINVVDMVDQEYNFIRFNGVNTQQLKIEGSSGSSLVMAANDLQVLVEAEPPLITAHGQFEINGTNSSLALNGGDPTSSVIEDPQVNSLTLNNVGTQADPISGASVMWQETLDANNEVSRSKMKIDGSIKEVRWF